MFCAGCWGQGRGGGAIILFCLSGGGELSSCPNLYLVLSEKQRSLWTRTDNSVGKRAEKAESRACSQEAGLKWSSARECLQKGQGGGEWEEAVSGERCSTSFSFPKQAGQLPASILTSQNTQKTQCCGCPLHNPHESEILGFNSLWYPHKL